MVSYKINIVHITMDVDMIEEVTWNSDSDKISSCLRSQVL